MKERRLVPRWNFKRPFRYRLLEEKTASGGVFQDINLVGAKAHLNAPVAVKSKITLAITIPNQLMPIIAEGEVIWQNPSMHREFPTGIRFISFNPSDKERVLNYFQSEIRQNWWRGLNESVFPNKR